MNEEQIIQPFPLNIDRNLFGAWLSGFIDGEGTFNLYLTDDKPKASFGLVLRFDDKEILRLIQSYWECGGIYDIKRRNITGGKNPEVNFTVAKHEDLEYILLPHFDRFPLFAKKKHSFKIWKDAIKYMTKIKNLARYRSSIGERKGRSKKWLPIEIEQFRTYHDQIRRVRTANAKDSLCYPS